jgi:hypothetical protein
VSLPNPQPRMNPLGNHFAAPSPASNDRNPGSPDGRIED